MKSYLLLAAALVTCSLANAQTPGPAPIAPTVPTNPMETRKMLEAIRETNAKLIEQQAKTLQLLEEMEKTSQTLKTLGKRA